MSTPSQPADRVRPIRMLAVALVLAPVFIAVAAGLALPPDGESPKGMSAVVVALLVVSFLAAELVGFRVTPLTPAEAATASDVSLMRYQTTMFLRFALAEAPVIVTLALSFAFALDAWPLVVATVLGVPLIAYEVWPTARNVRKIADRLEANGVRSGLRETFGV